MKADRYHIFIFAALVVGYLTSVANASAFDISADNPLTVAEIFSDHMVLQRNQTINVWGTAGPHENVAVKFASGAHSTTADAVGRWQVKLAAMKAGGPYEMVITTDNETIRFHDVYLGDVWLASGQSNMAFRFQSASDPEKETLKQNAGKHNIRTYEVAKVVSGRQLLNETDKPWEQVNSASVDQWSAVAFYFAKGLYEHLDVPIGIINCSQGGSRIEAWMSREALRKTAVPEETFSGIFGLYNNPSTLYDSMLSDLIPYTLKGVIWYQGESNTEDPESYQRLLSGMIRQWRAEWDQQDLPFLFAQLPDFEKKNDSTGVAWARLRSAQQAVAESEPNTGMVVLIDAGERHDIHPTDKKIVGERFVRAARAVAYGENIDYAGPSAKTIKYKGNQVIISYDHAKSGLVVKGTTIPGFVVCGEERTWVPAAAKIRNGRVWVSHPEAKKIFGVRYAWANAPETNLYNGKGLPAAPFSHLRNGN